MNMNDRAAQAGHDSMNWFPHKAGDPVFATLALAGEVGEAANILKKVERGSAAWMDVYHDLAEEIIDVQVYLNNLMDSVNVVCDAQELPPIDWEGEYERKRSFNASRFDRDEEDAESDKPRKVIPAIWDRSEPRETPPLVPSDYFKSRGA
jgi:NTP pyrophosphatase (non-canonical NTP hydrolase)